MPLYATTHSVTGMSKACTQPGGQSTAAASLTSSREAPWLHIRRRSTSGPGHSSPQAAQEPLSTAKPARSGLDTNGVGPTREGKPGLESPPVQATREPSSAAEPAFAGVGILSDHNTSSTVAEPARSGEDLTMQPPPPQPWPRGFYYQDAWGCTQVSFPGTAPFASAGKPGTHICL